MARPKKCRKVCQMPSAREFRPAEPSPCTSAVILCVDEYETIRLIDREGFSQEECASFMQVARTTVQMIYNSARKKIADALVEGRTLQIQGGDFRLCDGQEESCACGGCRKHRQKHHHCKEDGTMRIAIPLDENKQDVCLVLARAPYFLFRDGDQQTVVENPAAQAPGGAGVQAAQFLVDSQVATLITPRCGQNAAEVFTAAGMTIYKSAGKTAAENLKALGEGKLEALTHFHGGFHGIQ